MPSPATRRPRWFRRDPHDREIWRLALPALGALIAEPLYVLADTAIVGRLGTHQLGGLGIAATLLSAAFGVFNFLAFGTTASVARSVGARDERSAAEHGIAGLWLAVTLGIALAVLGIATAPWLVRAMGASDSVRPYALTYLRISLLGAPFVLFALAGTGYLRGTQNTKTPLVIAVVANGVNLVLEIVLVYGLDLGIAGSAWGTVAAQVGAAAAYLAIVGAEVRRSNAAVLPKRSYLREAAIMGGQLTIRTGSLLVAFVTGTAVAARLGDAQIAAHQVAWQIWFFLALTLDAIAIAAQAIVGRALGAGDASEARRSSQRMIQWGVLSGLGIALLVLLMQPALMLGFTNDEAVRDQLLTVLWIVAVMQPIASVVFVLDGILIGAGDSAYLAWAMAGATAVYLPAALLVLATGAPLAALWGAITLFMVARLIGMGARYRTDAWLVTGVRSRA